ncbi:RagB/SusD family nutrient uptake outer membrane protein [Fodinibius sp.]|uniref:RagB/SusD family nutrient uptake outer membrane protein n=1 Tax=Fodinibius sp. TaxID=1872440 RepID=UPI003563EEC4
MKSFNHLLGFLIAAVLVSSCTDFLNKEPVTEFTKSNIWQDPALAESYVNQIYDEIPWSMARNAGNVDESRSRAGAGFNVNNALITADNSGFGDWGANYSSIRKANKFLANIEEIDFGDAESDGVPLKDRITGEIHFLRAYFYFNLASYHGGVPIITKVYELGEEYQVPRDSFADVIDFIVEDLNTAANLLPETNSGSNNGRASKGAALALKSRVLLYAASDLYNPEKNGTITGGYSNPELLGYTGGDPTARWEAARDAAKEVIDMGVYRLYMPNPSSAEEATQNYGDLFTSQKSPEDIFVRYRSNSLSEGYDGWAIAPNGWYGNAGVGAISELVDAYRMADGSKFDRDNPDHVHKPYEDRDPRLTASILYEGNEYRPRPDDLVKYDPVGVGQFGTWERWDSENNEMYREYGLDTRNSIANPWNGNRTGATMLKFLDKNVDIEQSNQDLTWRYIRYSEILLNYAEASIELGQEAEARKYLNMLRQRAYMPDITATGEELMEEYRNERRIELVYENKRFFDVRRWMIGPQAYHPVHGVEIVYELQEDNTTAEVPTVTPIKIMDGKWEDKMYFFPISRDELNRNDELIQNPGYN